MLGSPSPAGRRRAVASRRRSGAACGEAAGADVTFLVPVSQEFLEAATAFCNDKLWGTLSATLMIHPKEERRYAEALATCARGQRSAPMPTGSPLPLRRGSLCVLVARRSSGAARAQRTMSRG